GRDRLERCQFRRAVVEEADHAVRLPEFRHPAEIARPFQKSGSLYPYRFSPRPWATFSSLQLALVSRNLGSRFHKNILERKKCPSKHRALIRSQSMPAPSLIRRPAPAPRRSTRPRPTCSTTPT